MSRLNYPTKYKIVKISSTITSHNSKMLTYEFVINSNLMMYYSITLTGDFSALRFFYFWYLQVHLPYFFLHFTCKGLLVYCSIATFTCCFFTFYAPNDYRAKMIELVGWSFSIIFSWNNYTRRVWNESGLFYVAAMII